MKKITFLLLIFLLASCGVEETKEKTVIKETWEIVNGYTDNLTETVIDAKEIQKSIDESNQILKDNLEQN